jgi:mannan polymerase II complex MNN10 subunit
VRALHDREKAKGNALNDQEAMRDFLKSGSSLTKHTLRIPQWKINAFPPEIGCYDESKIKWARGMLVVHFAGAWAHVKEKDPTGLLMKKYEREIIWG